MPRYGKQSKTGVAEILHEAVHYFGPGGIGLDVKESTEECARFEGGGGFVFIRVCTQEEGSEVVLETREWDYDVQRFLEKI